MKYFVYATLVGVGLNGLITVLPSLRKHFLYFLLGLLSPPLLMIFVLSLFPSATWTIFPIFLFSFIVCWNVFLLFNNFSSKKLPIPTKVVLAIFVDVLSLILISYLFIFSFVPLANIFYYYTFPCLIFWIIWAWILINQWKLYYFTPKLTQLLMGVCLILLPTMVWGQRHNPLIEMHRESYHVNGKEQTFRERNILKHLQSIEELIALDLMDKYQNLETISFLDVSQRQKSLGLISTHRFKVTVLVNHNHTIVYDVNLSLDDRPFYFSRENADNHHFYKESPENEKNLPLQKTDYRTQRRTPFSLDDLEEKAFQNQLRDVEITYYLKDDIYKSK